MVLKNKKGIFFTSLAIIIISLFLISSTLYSQIKERTSIQKRIETMNNFVFSIENDISRQNYISGYRAILSIQSYITNKGEYIPNAEKAIKEALINGTVENESINLMEGFQLKDWNPKISVTGDLINVLVNYTLLEVNVSQTDPWSIIIGAKINLIIKDKGGLAQWNKTEVINSKVEILGFEDPIYLIGSNGLITKKINKTSFYPFVQNNNITNLSVHSQKSLYYASSDAPSYLNRLEGITTPSPNGIESLVYIPELIDQQISIKSGSIVDHLYFSNSSESTYTIQGMPSWFKLDSSHLSVYQVQNLTS